MPDGQTSPAGPVRGGTDSGTIAAYILSFVGLGLVNASLGPALPHLARHTGATLAAVSWVFAAYRTGYLVGSLLGGRLFDRVRGNRLLALALLLMAGIGVLVPVVPLLGLLLAAFAVVGVMGGAVDVGGNVLLVWMAPPRLASVMSLLHLAFGVGAFLSPLFLSQALRWTGDIQWGYWSLLLVVAVSGLWLLRRPSPKPEKDSNKNVRSAGPAGLTALLVAFLLLYVGAEASFGGWVYTYALRKGLADAVTAGYLTSVYWGAYSAGRLLSAGAALRWKPDGILWTSIIGSLASILMLVVLPDRTAMVWVGTILFGLFMGPIFPTAVVYASRVMPLTGRITGLFLVGASIGAMGVPWLIGQLFEGTGPGIVLTVIATSVAAATMLLVAISLRAAARRPAV